MNDLKNKYKEEIEKLHNLILNELYTKYTLDKMANDFLLENNERYLVLNIDVEMINDLKMEISDDPSNFFSNLINLNKKRYYYLGQLKIRPWNIDDGGAFFIIPLNSSGDVLIVDFYEAIDAEPSLILRKNNINNKYYEGEKSGLKIYYYNINIYDCLLPFESEEAAKLFIEANN